MQILNSLREFNFLSVCARLMLALIAGGVLGFGRAQKKQTAGLRTYIITTVGASLTTLISFYEFQMLYGQWSWTAALSELKFDGSRFSAAVLSGIGFLAAGSIMLIAHQQVSGLTTAIGLFVAACMGVAAGAGFYEAVIVSVFFIVLVMEVMQPFEVAFKRRTRNMTIHVDFQSMENMDEINATIQKEGARIYEFELEDLTVEKTNPSAIVSMKLSKENPSHSAILSSVAELICVSSVQELIS